MIPGDPLPFTLLTVGKVAVTGTRRIDIALKNIFIFSICGLVTPASPPSCVRVHVCVCVCVCG